MEDTKQAVFDIIADTFAGKPSKYLGTDCEFDKLYEIFKKQKITPVLYRAACLNHIENAFFEKLKKEYKKSLFRQTLQDSEKKTIKAYFEENEIAYIELKGDKIRKLYPGADMRPSVDIDLLVKSADYSRSCDILKKLDYSYASETKYHTSFKKNPMLNVEIHTMLCDPDIVVGFESEFDVWQKALKKDESSYEYELSNEDLYIYLLAHFAQHMMSAGTGIRCIIDLYLLLRKYGSEFDNDYLTERLKAFGFEKLACACFDAGEIVFSKKKCENEMQALFTDYLFNCAYGGTSENLRILRIIKSGSKKQEMRRRTFPGKEAMEQQYPIIKKCKLMLPVCHIIRIIKNSGRLIWFAKKMNKIGKTDNSKIEKTNEIYDYLGLCAKKRGD